MKCETKVKKTKKYCRMHIAQKEVIEPTKTQKIAQYSPKMLKKPSPPPKKKIIKSENKKNLQNESECVQIILKHIFPVT